MGAAGGRHSWVYRSCARRLALGHLGADMLAQVGPHRLQGNPHRVLDGIGARGTMADDGDTAHTEEWGPAVFGIVQGAEHGPDIVVLEECRRIAPEHPDDEARHRLIELEHDVPDEAVAYHDIHGAVLFMAGQDVAALDVSDEVDSGA